MGGMARSMELDYLRVSLQNRAGMVALVGWYQVPGIGFGREANTLQA